jgi:sec-independent protein translocase protein TatA
MGGFASHWYYILIVLVVVLIIWGPGKLPDVGAGLGRAIREFRKASSETRDTFMNATNEPPAHSEAPHPVAPAPPLAPPPAPPAVQPQHSQTPPQTPVSG